MVTLAEYGHHGQRTRERKLHYSPTQIGTTTMDYDAHGRIAEITDVASIGQLSDMEFGYDSAGNLSSKKYDRLTTGHVGGGDRFEYDAFHRLQVSWLGLDAAGMNGPVTALSETSSVYTTHTDSRPSSARTTR